MQKKIKECKGKEMLLKIEYNRHLNAVKSLQ